MQCSRIIILLTFIFLNTHSLQAMSVPLKDDPCSDVKAKMDVKHTNVKQGDFFYVLISNIKEKPKLWFNAREFETFEISSEIKDSCGEYKVYRAFIPVENLTKPGSYAVLARTETWEEKIPVNIRDSLKPISRIWTKGPDIVPTAKELNAIGSGLATRTKDKKWQGKFIYPSTASKSSAFGVKRSYNGGPVESYHKGLDFAATTGSPVLAPSDAKVILTGEVKDGFKLHGNTVMLDHGQGITSIYMHLSKINVKSGETVSQGQKIGEVGSTGIATGPHLHWGLYLYGTSTEPENFVKEEYL